MSKLKSEQRSPSPLSPADQNIVYNPVSNSPAQNQDKSTPRGTHSDPTETPPSDPESPPPNVEAKRKLPVIMITSHNNHHPPGQPFEHRRRSTLELTSVTLILYFFWVATDRLLTFYFAFVATAEIMFMLPARRSVSLVALMDRCPATVLIC